MSDLARPLAEAAERLFAQRCSAEAVNRAEDGAWPQALWQAVEDLAPARLLVPEERGGAGGDWRDACALLERVGEFNVPLPVAESVIAGWLLDRAGQPAGEGPLGFACADADLATMQAHGHIDLRLRAVPWASACTALVVAARDGAGVTLLHLPRGSFSTTPGRALSGEPRDAVSLRIACTDGCVTRLVDLNIVDCLGRAALLRAAMIGGACRRVLALTLAYTNDRKQFGRPIGQFQAVQHQLAQLAEETAAVRVAVQAAAACDSAWSTAAIAAAKLRAGEAAGLCTRIAHQLHGAIGITYEHALHQSTRRLLTWRDEHGAEAWWALELVETLRRQGAQGAWAALTAVNAR
ncbi:MAG: acyl-CoA dehydrogenase family protein [Burkholderiaceae bacterium]|nr:acyl-CoA dehydrogenase family protein [Burkholderiaceae bacterium]